MTTQGSTRAGLTFRQADERQAPVHYLIFDLLYHRHFSDGIVSGTRSAQDQEGSGPGQRASLRVQEEVGAMTAVEVRAAVGQVATQSIGGVAPDGHDALLAALSRAGDETALQVDVPPAWAAPLTNSFTSYWDCGRYFFGAFMSCPP